MKYGKTILIIIFILTLLTLSTACADENVTENTTYSPDIRVPAKIWKDGNYNITIETNEASQIDISGAVTYNSTVNPGKTSIPIENLSTGRHSICINSNDTQKQYNITVLRENPHWNLDFTEEESEELYGPPWDHELIGSSFCILNAPEGLTGNFSFYVNNRLIGTWDAQKFLSEPYFYEEYYEVGTYNYTITYSGDDYFYPASKTKIREFTELLITIPEEVILGDDDYILIKSESQIINGRLIIRINNKTVYDKSKITDIYFQYNLNQLELNKQYDIEVIFTSAYLNKTKKATVNVTDHIRNYVTFKGEYYSDVDSFKYIYGKENYYNIISPKINLNISIDGNEVESTYYGSRYIVNVSDLAPGTHRITASYAGNEKYAENTFYNDFEVVVRGDYPTSVKQNELCNMQLTLPEDAAGNLTVEIVNLDKGTKYYKSIELEEPNLNITLPTDNVGHYQFNCYFNGNYELNEIMGKYFVKDFAKWSLNHDYWFTYLNDSVILTLKLPNDGIGNLTVEVKRYGEDYANYTIEVNRTCKVTLPTDHIGEYAVKTSFDGNYDLNPYEYHYEVDSEYFIEIMDVMGDCELDYNSKHYVYIELPKDGIGTLTLEVKYGENDNYTIYKSVKLNKGKASIKFPTNHVGKIYYNTLYSGNYEIYNITGESTIIYPIYTFKNSIATIIANKELNGNFIVTDYMAGKTFTKRLANGTASIDLRSYAKKLNKPTSISLEFISDENDNYYLSTVQLNPNIKVVAKNVVMYYGDSKVFKAKIYRNGKVVGKGEKITVKIGSKTYKLTTDKNGIVKIKITQTPNKYTIRVIYKGMTFKKKLTVKQTLTLKKATVKKSTKKLILTATLKKGKKAIKNKKITFKFNGKTYKTKTNSKGIAKITINKSVLKKLKVGKKVTYQATYLKTTVKKTAKVKK
ncbi:MAG: Ig-like domain-containing protein [Methanobrevibacter sp.]|nr:Ig-like domain-containing protein [Methanobrevibacter sp.]